LESRSLKTNPEFSPDGHWVAYDSADSGARQVFVTPYPGPGGNFPVSTDGGAMPRWSREGPELFYLNGGKMMAVEVQTGATFHAGIPKILFERNPPPADYDVSPDGRRFLMIKQEMPRQAQSNQFEVIVNWFEELRRVAPMAR